MKISASKIIKSWLTKLKPNKSKNYLNKYTISIVAVFIFVILILFYFLRPIYFDYTNNKKILENKVNKTFELKTNFNENISYKVFPTPRILVENANINFINTDKKKIKIKKLYILISPLNLSNFEKIKFKKILIKSENIELHPENFKKYFKYLTIRKNKTFVIKNSDFYFIDAQGNKVIFKELNFNEKFTKKIHQIDSSFNFAENKVNINFSNYIGSQKNLKINIPSLKQSLDIKFDKNSNLNFALGELKLRLLETLILLNFEGKQEFKIYNSFLRNKFINSKIKGKISFKNNFYFNLDLGINRIDLRKLLLTYPIFKGEGISKKINGKLNIKNKSTNSFFGNINDSTMSLIFENGDIKIKDLSAQIMGNSQIKSNISFLQNNKKPIIKFSINFFTKDPVKFFRKFGIYKFDKSLVSFNINGNIDVKSKKINLKEVIKNNNEKINNKEILIIEKAFNNFVLNEGIIGIFDFFKIKKFIKEIY